MEVWLVCWVGVPTVEDLAHILHQSVSLQVYFLASGTILQDKVALLEGTGLPDSHHGSGGSDYFSFYHASCEFQLVCQDGPADLSISGGVIEGTSQLLDAGMCVINQEGGAAHSKVGRIFVDHSSGGCVALFVCSLCHLCQPAI